MLTASKNEFFAFMGNNGTVSCTSNKNENGEKHNIERNSYIFKGFFISHHTIQIYSDIYLQNSANENDPPMQLRPAFSLVCDFIREGNQEFHEFYNNWMES